MLKNNNFLKIMNCVENLCTSVDSMNYEHHMLYSKSNHPLMWSLLPPIDTRHLASVLKRLCSTSPVHLRLSAPHSFYNDCGRVLNPGFAL